MKKIGELLKETSNLSDASLKKALEAARVSGERVGSALLKSNDVDDVDILKALSVQFKLRMLHSLPTEINTDFTKVVSIGFLKKNRLVPVQSGKERFIAICDPTDYQPQDDLCRMLGWNGVEVVLCRHQAIISSINYAYDMTQDSAEEVLQDIEIEDPEQLFDEIEEIGDLLDDTSSAPVIRLVNLMFSQAVRNRASDIHIEPYQSSLKIRQRLDGILYDLMSPPKHVQSSLVSRVKIMAKLDIAEKRLPQDGRIELKVGNKDIDVRVSTLPTAFGERVVLRLLDKSSVLMSLVDLGIPSRDFGRFNQKIKAANGIVLVTGPTGSGKTTTLYAALSSINNTEKNIITVEDPVEYRISGIGQVQVNPKIDLTFASGLRSIVRQDPDVILVGEIRDTETAEIAIQSALTGHLVFSTLHTNDSASAITRLSDMGIESFLIASSVNAILAQRLVRMICPDCKEAYTPGRDELRRIGVVSEGNEDRKVYRGRGCSKCHHTGYRGRCGIFELMVMTRDMKRLVMQTSDANAIKQSAIAKTGMITLQKDGANKVMAGITTIEEVYRVCQN